METKQNSSVGLSASFGGPGFVPRKLTHEQELRGGGLWSPCGVAQEWAPLRSVLLAWPQDSLDTDDLEGALLLRRVSVKAIRSQTESLRAFYEGRGIQVYLHQPRTPAPPNLIFMRDAFFMTPEGAIVGRMGGQARAGEERFIAEALALHGIPIRGMIHGSGCFEGADALWMDERRVLIGGGFRTNDEGIRQVTTMLSEMGVSTEVVALPKGTQHLLGVVNFVSQDKAVVRGEICSEQIRRVLEGRGVSVVSLAPTDEVTQRRAMNFVTLEPNCIVMPGDCPKTRRIYEGHGIECFELDVSEYLNAGGALACLTGIVERSSRGRIGKEAPSS